MRYTNDGYCHSMFTSACAFVHCICAAQCCRHLHVCAHRKSACLRPPEVCKLTMLSDFIRFPRGSVHITRQLAFTCRRMLAALKTVCVRERERCPMKAFPLPSVFVGCRAQAAARSVVLSIQLPAFAAATGPHRFRFRIAGSTCDLTRRYAKEGWYLCRLDSLLRRCRLA